MIYVEPLARTTPDDVKDLNGRKFQDSHAEGLQCATHGGSALARGDALQGCGVPPHGVHESEI